jgi:P27 family predicted phage terminase small subunit
MIETPEELSGNALLAWHAFAAELGEVLPEDRAALIVLSLAWAEMQDAERHIQANGTIIKQPNGWPGPNPFCKVRKEARSVVTKLLNEMGLTRIAKSKMKPKTTDDEQTTDISF